MKNNRKTDHLVLSTQQFKHGQVLEDVELLHNCLPDINFEDINLSATFTGLHFDYPIMINAITGGTKESYEVNRSLGYIAKELGIPIAVGSQNIVLKDPTHIESFQVIREVNPNGIVLSNLGAYATPDMAKKACDMISADALQIHLNVPQELAMPEGDRNFVGYKQNITNIISSVSVPVIVKEVGFGIKRDEIIDLEDTGIKAVDISGTGGTNFIKLENDRGINETPLRGVESWGLNTGKSLIEALSPSFNNLDIIASGGFTSSLDIAKALALGAKSVALAGFPLYILWNYGEKKLLSELKKLLYELKCIFLFCGAVNLSYFSDVPLIIGGKLKEYAEMRGIDITKYARRSMIKTRY